MATLKELAREYRASAAKLALWLEDHEGDTADPEAVKAARKALQEVRDVQRLLDGYYDLPRPEGISANGWKAGRHNDD